MNTKHKLSFVIFFAFVFLTTPIWAGGHAGNGQENKPIGEILSQMPDQDVLLEKLNLLEPDFPFLIGVMKEGVKKALCIRYSYINPEYIAYSSFGSEKDQFVIDFYENYFQQNEKDRLTTLFHELLHYVHRQFISDRKEEWQELERHISIMAYLITTILFSEGNHYDHKLQLGQFARTYEKKGRIQRSYDKFKELVREFIPHQNIKVGGQEQTLKIGD